MKPTGNAELLIAARRALLDALDALTAHRQSVIVIGAQAIYLHTGAAAVGLAETTKDSDLISWSRRRWREDQDGVAPGSLRRWPGGAAGRQTPQTR